MSDHYAPFERYVAALRERDEATIEEVFEIASQDEALAKRILFFHLFEEGDANGEGSQELLPESTPWAEVQRLVEAEGWTCAQEAGNVYALKGHASVLQGQQLGLCSLTGKELTSRLHDRIAYAIGDQALPYYIGMSYTCDLDGLLRLFPLFMRPWGVEQEQLTQTKRVFLTLRAFSRELLHDLEHTLVLLMYRLGRIDGYAHGYSLNFVKEETLVKGERAQF